MREYSKTENLYKRNPNKKSELLIGQFTRSEFAYINKWSVTEKVDGTNVQLRFYFDNDITWGGLASYEFHGRTEKAQFTFGQADFLEDLGFRIRHDAMGVMNNFSLESMTLYGELYGPKIQAGGNYSDELGFRLFDILVNDKVWLAPDAVKTNAEVLGVDMVPIMGIMTTDEIFELVKGGFVSTFARNREYLAEGVVATTPVPMYDQRGDRIKWKLKTKDLRNL